MQSKLWYRLVKVVYILFLLLILVSGSSLMWEGRPYRIVDNEKSYVQCDRDIKAGLVYFLDKNNWGQYGEVYGDKATLSYSVDDSVRRTCARSVDSATGKPSLEEIFNSNFKPDLNYKFYPSYSTEGTYWEFVKGYLIFYFFLCLSAVILREIFYYIATGKRMFASKYHYYEMEEKTEIE